MNIWVRSVGFIRSKALVGMALTLCLCAQLSAVQTQTWEINTVDEFLLGELSQLVLTSEGMLRLGYGYKNLGEFAKEIWTAEVGSDGVIYFGTGSPSAVFRIGKNNQVEELFSVDTTAVTDLVIDQQGDLFISTLGEGKILRYQRKGGVSEFCILPEQYVWKMITDRQGNLFAATGPHGNIYRISPSGHVEEWFVSEESNILSLAFDSTDALLAGGSDRGVIYKITDKGQGIVLYQFEEEEVRTLAVKGGFIYAGLNKQKDQRHRDLNMVGQVGKGFDKPSNGVGLSSDAKIEGSQQEKLQVNRIFPARESDTMSGSIYARDADGRVELLAHWDDEPVLDMAFENHDGLLVGVGKTGRVYRVPVSTVGKTDSYEWELLFDFPQNQVVSLATKNDQLAFIGTGNVGIGYIIEEDQAEEGTFTSQVRDSQFLSKWGNIFWQGNGILSMSVRTGNTSLPDQTWMDWSLLTNNLPAKVENPDTRFIQIRAKLSGNDDASLDKITLYYLPQNQKPTLSMVDVIDANQEGGQRMNSIDESSQQGNGIPPSGADRKIQRNKSSSRISESKPQRKQATSIKLIKWEGTDPDGDSLIYRLYYKEESEEVWIPISIDKALAKSEYLWNTDSIPDGWYELKVIASDENANPEDAQLIDVRVSNRFKVDNRRPEIRNLTYDARRIIISGHVQDGLSMIRSLEYSIDGGDWIQFLPTDGIIDDKEEVLSVKLNLPRGEFHSVAVRAIDEEGNIGVETVSVRGE